MLILGDCRVDGLNWSTVSPVQNLRCRRDRNPWIAGVQMLAQNLECFRCLLMEDLPHFGRQLWSAARISALALPETTFTRVIRHLVRSCSQVRIWDPVESRLVPNGPPDSWQAANTSMNGFACRAKLVPHRSITSITW